MSQSRTIIVPLPPELQPVADAAGVVLRSEVDEDPLLDEHRAAAQAAIITAIQQGHELTVITRAETRGRDAARAQLRGELLRRIERTARRVEETTAEHHAAIKRGDRAGLSTRDLGNSAGIAPATVRVITGRPVPLFGRRRDESDASPASTRDSSPAAFSERPGSPDENGGSGGS